MASAERLVTIRSLAIATVGAVVILGAVGCAKSSSPDVTATSTETVTVTTTTAAAPVMPSTTTQASAAPNSESQDACAGLGGTVDADGICRVHTVAANYEITMVFPTDYPDLKAVTDYLSAHEKDFIDFISDRPARDFPYELDLTAETYRSGDASTGTQSVVFTEYNDSGGAHPTTGYQSFNYDLGAGAPITFDTLFRPDTQPVDVLDPIARREMEKRWEGSGGTVNDNILGAAMYDQFALTDDAVIFFIGQGNWLPQAAGPLEVSVPRTDLAAVLA